MVVAWARVPGRSSRGHRIVCREPTDPAAVDIPDPGELALEWHVRAQSGLLTPDERRALDGWLAADPANLRAFREVDELWRDAAGLEAAPVSGRRSEEHTYALQSLMRSPYAVF